MAAMEVLAQFLAGCRAIEGGFSEVVNIGQEGAGHIEPLQPEALSRLQYISRQLRHLAGEGVDVAGEEYDIVALARLPVIKPVAGLVFPRFYGGGFD
ncbi:hypothetical protein ES708_14260 [subsurface metagenome]